MTGCEKYLDMISLYIDGKLVKPQKLDYYKFYKPAGYITTADDEKNWVAVADYTAEGIEGSPVHIPISKVCKSVKISFLNKPGAAKPSVWELLFY